MKIRILYLFLLLTFFSPLFSQYSEEKKVVLDKLSKCTEDTAKVFYLNRYSMLNQSNDFKIAYEYATKALEIRSWLDKACRVYVVAMFALISKIRASQVNLPFHESRI